MKTGDYPEEFWQAVPMIALSAAVPLMAAMERWEKTVDACGG